MSTRKRPLGEITNPPSASRAHTTTTPRRYAPSTPHAIRALQQRSATKVPRSVRTIRRFAPDEVDPASARGVLRRFAKITAPTTRPKRTPTTTGKENSVPEEEFDEEDREVKKPRMTFDFDESVEESIEIEPPEYTEYGDEEDSELLVAPTESILPEVDVQDPTITFESIDQMRRASKDKRKSRMSLPAEAESPGHENDVTMMTERGRRAFTEEATGRLSRYSFGSIRMSDFGSELEIARNSDERGRLSMGNNASGNSLPMPVLDETQLSASMDITGVQQEHTHEDLPMIDDFQLEMPDDTIVTLRDQAQEDLPLAVDDEWEDEDANDAADEPMHLSPKSKRRLTELQLATSRQESGRRRRKVKMTRHGTLAPALPTSLIKKIATEVQVRHGRRKPAFGPEHIKALEQATEWFFEQIGEDLATYSTHGRRKRRIDNADVLLLMQRQRMAVEPGQLKKLAQDWLPKGVLSTLELPE